MSKLALLKILLSDDASKTLKKIILVSTISMVALMLFLAIIICSVLSMPKEWLKNFILGFEGDTHIEIFYQIRPDLIDPTPEEAPNNDKEYEFVLPIKRTVRHYFGEIGSFNGAELDYIVFNCDGDNIYSIGDGKVTEADNTSITVEYKASDSDPNNWYIYAKYWPLSDVKVSVGDTVKKGQIIAQADALGDAKVDEYSTLRIFCFGMWGDSDPDWINPIDLIGEKTFQEQYREVIRE